MRRKQININKQAAALKRELQEVEKKQTAAAGILQTELPAAKARVYEHLESLAALGVAEDYTRTLLYIAATRGNMGVRLALLRTIAPDQIALDDARKELGTGNYNAVEDGTTMSKTGAGLIEEKTDGNAVTIHITADGKKAFEAANS